MNALSIIGDTLPETSPAELDRILAAETRIGAVEECRWSIEHVLHGGMYARTARIAADTVIVGTLIRIPTLLIVQGNCLVYAGSRWHELQGYQVIPARGGRKQIFATRTATDLTMIFPTKARTVEEAENEFTGEAERLHSRRWDGKDLVTITEDQLCRA